MTISRVHARGGKGKTKNIGTRLQLANRKMGKYIM